MGLFRTETSNSVLIFQGFNLIYSPQILLSFLECLDSLPVGSAILSTWDCLECSEQHGVLAVEVKKSAQK